MLVIAVYSVALFVIRPDVRRYPDRLAGPTDTDLLTDDPHRRATTAARARAPRRREPVDRAARSPGTRPPECTSRWSPARWVRKARSSRTSLRELASDAADQLGGYRIGELRAACAALGVSDHRWLGGVGRWRDSGMVGVAANGHPRAFAGGDLAEQADALAEVIADVRPQVVITYGPDGGYGHPDHIRAHEVTMAACTAGGRRGPGVLRGDVPAGDRGGRRGAGRAARTCRSGCRRPASCR